MPLAGVGGRSKQGKSCFQPEPCVAQEASGSASAESALDDAGASIVVAPGLSEDCWHGGFGLFGHGWLPFCGVLR